MDTASRDSRSTILIVDDSPENLTALGAVLMPEHRVRVANGGRKALGIVESDDPPDLVLLDVMMPEVDGFEVCRRIKANPARRDIPVIFVTALDEARDERLGLEIGAIDYLTKPINPALVGARVRNHLELIRARRALAEQNVALEARVAERTADLERTQEELKQSYLETIHLAYDVMSQADDFLGTHCKRVAGYAARLAERLRFDREPAFDVYVAALLHDIALVSLPQEELRRLFLLETPSRTGDRLYWAHPVAQLQVISTSARFARTADIIARHHESLDGSGFPAGSWGDTIPIGSRVLAVADRWDIFSHVVPRPHTEPPSFETFMDRNIGRLDLDVLEALAAVLRQGDPFSRTVDRQPGQLEPGMVLARAVRTTRGTVLLSAGTELRRDHLQELEPYAAGGELELPLRVYRHDED